MAKVFKSKIFLGVLCLLLSAVIAFVILPSFYASKGDTATAVKLKQTVSKGTVITQEMLTREEVGTFGLPSSVILNSEEVIGNVATDTMFAGEYLTDTRLLTAEEYKVQFEDTTSTLEPGYCLVTVEVPNSSAAVASVLRGGSLVDTYECIEAPDKTVTVQKVISSLYVQDVLNSSLESLAHLDEKLESAVVEDDVSYDFLPAFVVFRCTEAQAQTLIRLERSEALHLTLTNAGG